MNDMPASRNRELVLPPGTYAFVLDNTKGRVSAYVGPYKNSLSDTDQLVSWDASRQRYVNVENTAEAQQSFAVAEQGQYIVLTNPAADGSSEHPPKAMATDAADLEVGRRVVVAGPAAFPLWPGQTAQTIDGHHLRHNQYVVVSVYDDQLAQENWRSVVMAPQTPSGDSPPPASGDPLAPLPVAPVLSGDAPKFTMGQLIVVPGTQVSFYMPSTGMEVVPEGDPLNVQDQRAVARNVEDLHYVRNAVTLETLEYCILLDENGQKRYVRGPAVVFPNPTETFKVNDTNSRVFDAIELNEQSGIYVKVIEAYDDGDDHHPVGEELFITGAEQAIYFPRAEHSIITYDGKRKHHAIAVPAGEGRYVLDRTSGNVDLKRGPTMLLPDPRTEVIVRRIMDPHDVETMYPGNVEALAINAAYTQQRDAATTDYLENAEVRLSAASRRGTRASFAGNETPIASYAKASPGAQNFLGDTLSRGTTYSPPRTVTLDTKYEGAVAISIFAGYAVLVTDKVGNRRVEVGPKVVLLGYDETIMALSLSMGRPKTDNRLLKTGYLRIINNVVTDIVTVETRDLVSVDVEVSYRVNFVGETDQDREKWFNVENYVQVLTDHCRSRLRNISKQHAILDFYSNAIDIIRDALLGVVPPSGERSGLTFEENGMQVYDVEVLGVRITDEEVEHLLTEAQGATLQGAIVLSTAEEAFTRETRLEDLKRQSLLEREQTFDVEAQIKLAQVEQETERRLMQVGGDLTIRAERLKIEAADRDNVRLDSEQGLELQRSRDAAEMQRLEAETTEMVKRVGAYSPGLIEALTAFSDTALVERIVLAIGPAALAAGVTTADMLTQVFEGTALEGIVKAFAERPLALSNGDRSDQTQRA